MKRLMVMGLLILISICALLWAVGTSTDFFANPAFSAFWWISHANAYSVGSFFVGFGAVGSCSAFVFLLIFLVRREEKTK